MPKYYKYNIEDLKELHKAVVSTEVAKWCNKHYYYTCSCCHKEELYHQSPVLSGKMWNDVCEKLGIEYPNGKIGKRHGHILRLGNNEEFYPAIRFYDMFKRIQKVEGDDTYTMLCRECIEKALGRPLYREDLDECGQNKMHINEYKKTIL